MGYEMVASISWLVSYVSVYFCVVLSSFRWVTWVVTWKKVFEVFAVLQLVALRLGLFLFGFMKHIFMTMCSSSLNMLSICLAWLN